MKPTADTPIRQPAGSKMKGPKVMGIEQEPEDRP